MQAQSVKKMREIIIRFVFSFIYRVIFDPNSIIT